VMDPDTDLSGEPYLAETRRDVPYVTLEVRDDGCGMDENTRAGIFEPFFSTKFLGRGLGLPAVLGIVKRHKGFIKVVSKPGEGSAFLIGFPTAGAGPDSGLKNAGMTNDGGDSIPGQAPR
jgi:two-component system cell cycle sensor histidine kinase/response regulator CckA